MPTYEYRCEEGHQFEAFQKMSDAPLTVCPECGASAERKISSGAGLVFKGTGFYATDYKKPSAAEAKSDGAASDGSKSDGGSKSESGSGGDSGSKGESGTSGSGGGDAKAAGGSG